MIDKIKIYGQKVIPWIGIIAVLYLMTLLQIPMFIKNLFMVIATSICLFFIWKDNSENKWEIAVLLLGLLGRIVFCYLDVYTDFRLPIGGSDDGIGFMERAIAYYHGDFSIQYTKYPYILNAIFQVTGINQYAAQYVNILCWSFSALVLQKSCKRLSIDGILRMVSLAIFAWLPTNIWITSILYRDAYIILLLFLSFYYLLMWMQDEKQYGIVLSVIAVLLATLLHGGSIMALVPVAFTLVFYSQKEKRFSISRKSIIMAITVIVLLAVVFIVPQTRELVLRKIPNMSGGLIEGLNRYLANKYDGSTAGSDYLTGRYLTGYFDIIIMTIQRMYYHTFSPTPDMWRGLTDIIAFFVSTAPVYLAAIVLWIVSIYYKKTDAYRLVLFLEIFVTIGVYAWGNKNAGSALRHREKILSLVILLAVYSLNIIIQKRKERKDNEKITTI